MSQDYHQNIFTFSNGFERSQQHHIAQQIRRDKLRIQGYEPPPPLVGIEEEESTCMLSEMFSFPSTATATELLENQILQTYRNPRTDWLPPRQGMVVGANFGDSKTQSVVNDSAPPHHQISSINGNSAAAMQLFLMNPQQQRSPSPPPSHHPESTPTAVHGGGGFGQFTWLTNNGNDSNPSEIAGVLEGQGLSLSLSSSLQHLGGGGQIHVGVASSYDAVNLLRNSKYTKAAQELLEEFCSVGRGGQLKKNKLRKQNNHDGNPSEGGGGGGNSSENPPLSSADRLEHQRRKVKLISMLDEVDRRYNHYCEQMQMVVNSFDMVMGFGAAVPYTSLAQKAMSRHFRCLKDAISAQLKLSCELLGEKDAGINSAVTKGETPRLRILDQSLRQQAAFHQMGMMEQEAWRPQRGLPERSVNILRAWLFEHFLHPYPSDADKHLLARQTGLSRNQVSNWFINARVRLWKPMVEEMYQQEAKDHDSGNEQSSGSAQTPTPPLPTTVPPPPTAQDNNSKDPSFRAHSFTHDQTMPENENIGSTLIRFGTNSGDVSLTLGLRHAGNLPEKTPFSVRDFERC